MESYKYIKEKQRLWAKINEIELVGSKLVRGEKRYTKEFLKNFFVEISKESLEEIKAGDGNEIGNGIYPGKIQAVHSSSSIAVNAFDYWRNRTEKAKIGQALLIPPTNIESIVFEKKYPVLKESNKSPNIDIVIGYKNGDCCAIECKFSEPFTGRQENHGLKEKYLTGFNNWELISSTYKLAASISPIDNTFRYLHAAQLIKHILGLLTAYKNDKSRFRLVYLYYDVFGKEGISHKEEIDEFTSIVKKDNIQFQSISWQDLILNIANEAGDKHNEYIKYLFGRYL